VGANVHSLYNDWLDGWSGHGDDASGTRRQKLVVVGSGWGAVGVIKKLKKGRYDITCVSEHNYFLFTCVKEAV